MTDPDMVDRAAHRAEDRRGHRLVWIFVGLAFLGIAVVATAHFSYREASTDKIRSLDQRADDNAEVARQLADQVERLGGVPEVKLPATDPDDPELQEGEVQDPERQDPETQDPERQDPEDQDPSIPGPSGASGVAGRDGMSPPCMAEPAQCRGADGRDGADGARGPEGPPGPTCPAGYSARSRTYDPTPLIPGGEETWWVCVADGGQG